MNKYDSFSIAHLQLYLDAMLRKKSNKGFVFWDELRDVLEERKLNNLNREKKP